MQPRAARAFYFFLVYENFFLTDGLLHLVQNAPDPVIGEQCGNPLNMRLHLPLSSFILTVVGYAFRVSDDLGYNRFMSVAVCVLFELSDAQVVKF